MGRRLKQVKKRFIEICRSTQRAFEMCRCRMRPVEDTGGEEISVVHDSKTEIQSKKTRQSASKTTSLSESAPSANSNFTWHCLTRHDNLPANIGPDGEYSPQLHYATSPEWSTRLPGDARIQDKFTNGAIGDVVLVSHGEEQFVRKKITGKKGQYEASVSIDSQCEFVAKLHSCYIQGDSVFLYLQYYQMKDLLYWMRKDVDRNVFTNEMSIWTTLHIFTALKAIHSKGIIHMDIKPSNILISNEGYPLLTDFGGAIRTCDSLCLHCATKAYQCPELRRDDSQLIRTGIADMWAATVIYYELATGYRPVYIASVQKCFRHTPARLGLAVENLPDVSVDFICSALQQEPTERLGYQGGVKELLMHDIFSEANWRSLVDRFHDTNSPLLDKLVALETEHKESRDTDTFEDDELQNSLRSCSIEKFESCDDLRLQHELSFSG